jgi:CheY-like chemotaxis protein
MARILVIDDEQEMRDLLRWMLEREGYEVVTAEDGKEGLRLYRENLADLIITDLIMPEMEGIETILALKHDFPGVKVIAMSGGGHVGPDPYLKIAEGVGAIRVFAKPFSREELLEAVRETLGGAA